MNESIISKQFGLFFCLVCVSVCCGCSSSDPVPVPASLGDQGPGIDGSSDVGGTIDDVKFEHQVASNREEDGTVGKLTFVDTAGDRVSIDQYAGKKSLVLVFTRGFAGELCPYCTTQTSRLIANYKEFQDRDAEVLLVYPGSKSQLPQFQEAGLAASGEGSFPFPVLLDEDLAAVKQLGIAAQLASPSTFIIDKEGKVRLSYVGASPADRPSIRAMLDQLDRLSEPSER